MARVHLGMKSIKDSQRIYRVYSGHRRRFFDTFLESGLVFLEIPDARLEPTSFDEFERVRQIVRRSRDINALIQRSGTAPPILPRLESYSGKTDKRDRTGNSLIGSVNALFNSAKVGDLVVSPGTGSYKEVLYGEITHPFSAGDTITLDEFGGLPVPVRKVRWIKKTPQAELVPFDIYKHLIGRTAVQHIKRTAVTEQFFDIAYESYVTSRVSRLALHAPLYDPEDFLATGEINAITGYLIATSVAVARGESDRISELSYREAIKEFISDETLEYYKQNFNSPGNSSFRTNIRKLGPVVAICLALASAGTLAIVAISGELQPSSALSEEEAEQCVEYFDHVIEMARSMGVERCGKIEAEMNNINEELGLEVPAVAINDELIDSDEQE